MRPSAWSRRPRSPSGEPLSVSRLGRSMLAGERRTRRARRDRGVRVGPAGTHDRRTGSTSSPRSAALGRTRCSSARTFACCASTPRRTRWASGDHGHPRRRRRGRASVAPGGRDRHARARRSRPGRRRYTISITLARNRTRLGIDSPRLPTGRTRRVDPAGDHPGAHPGRQRVRADLQQRTPDPGPVAVRLVRSSQADLNKTFDVALHIGTLLGARDLLPHRLWRYFKAGSRRSDARSIRIGGRAARMGARRRHDPRGDRGSGCSRASIQDTSVSRG